VETIVKLRLAALVIWSAIAILFWLFLVTVGGWALEAGILFAMIGTVWLVGVFFGLALFNFGVWVAEIVFGKTRPSGSHTVCTHCRANRWRWSKSTGYTCDNCGLKYVRPTGTDSQIPPL
jgi:hypothetical protein